MITFSYLVLAERPRSEVGIHPDSERAQSAEVHSMNNSVNRNYDKTQRIYFFDVLVVQMLRTFFLPRQHVMFPEKVLSLRHSAVTKRRWIVPQN